MSKFYDIAIVGGHGLVSKSIVKYLLIKKFPVEKLTVYGSKEHQALPLNIEGKNIKIEVIDENNIKPHDLVFFSGADGLSHNYAEEFIKKGAKIIDNSAHFRMLKSVPLVIPEINSFDLLNDSNIYAVPNCTATMVLLALHPIHKYFNIERLIVSSYQSASGAGTMALQELCNEQLDVNYEAKVLPSKHVAKKRLFNNILPIVDDINDNNNYTKEELKMRGEIKKIWHDEEIEVQATCVRVPTHIGHAASISAVCKEKIDLSIVDKLLKETPWLRIKDCNDYPDLHAVIDNHFVDVGRIRMDLDCEYTLNIFATSDNIVRGASYTAVMIAFKLIELKVI